MNRKIAIVLSVVLVFFSFTACSPPTLTLCSGDRQQPQNCIDTFFGCLSRADYDGADACLYNLSTLGFDEPMPEGLYAQLFQYLHSSRKYTIIDQSVSALDAEITIDLSSLDFRKIESVLTETVTNKVADLEYAGIEVADDQLSEMIQTTLSELMMDPAPYCSTERFVIQLYYENDMWQLVCTDELYSALTGYII